MYIYISFLYVKRPQRASDHSSPSSAGVKNVWIYTTCPPYALRSCT